jgi:hypothetical protein
MKELTAEQEVFVRNVTRRLTRGNTRQTLLGYRTVAVPKNELGCIQLQLSNNAVIAVEQFNKMNGVHVSFPPLQPIFASPPHYIMVKCEDTDITTYLEYEDGLEEWKGSSFVSFRPYFENR